MVLHSESPEGLERFIEEFKDIEVDSSKSVKWWWNYPPVQDEVNAALVAREYGKTIKLANQAIVEWNAIPIPPYASEFEVHQFKLIRDGYIASDYKAIALANFYLNKFAEAHGAAYKSINLIESYNTNTNSISQTFEAYTIVVRSLLWGIENGNEALSVALNVKTRIETLPDSAFNKKLMAAEILLLLAEAYRYNKNLSAAIESAQNGKQIFASVYSNSEKAREFAFARCECQEAMSKSGDEAKALFKSAAERLHKTYPTYENLGFPLHEFVKEHQYILYPHVKSISIDRELTPVFIEPDTPVKIYFDYIFPFSKKNPNARINFFSYKILLEVYRGVGETDLVYSDSIDITDVSTEPVKLSFDWPGFKKEDLIEEGETFIAKVSSVVTELHTGKQKVTANDNISLYYGVPLVIDEKNSTVVFPVKEAEVTTCKITYIVKLPASLTNTYNLKFQVQNEAGDQIYSDVRSNIQDGTGSFLWNICSHACRVDSKRKETSTPLNPGIYLIKLILESNFEPVKKDIYLTEREFTCLYVDLDIIPVTNEETDETPIAENLEESVGSIISIWPFGVSDVSELGMEDYIGRIKIHNIWEGSISEPTKNDDLKIVGRLHFDAARVAIWKDANRSEAIVPDVTEIDIETTTILYIQSLSSTIEKIEYYICDSHKRVDYTKYASDFIKKYNPKEYYSVYWGTGAGLEMYDNLTDFLLKEKKAIPLRKFVPVDATMHYLIPTGVTNEYNWLFLTPLKADEKWLQRNLNSALSNKMYLSIPHHIVFSGHSNFGAGFSFHKTIEKLDELFNIGNDLIAFQWHYTKNYCFPAFKPFSRDNDYGDDPRTTEKYDPWQVKWETYEGMYNHQKNVYTKEAYYSEYQGSIPAQHLHLTQGADATKDYHFTEFDNETQKEEKVVVAKGGSADLPNDLTYTTLYLSGCNTGKYFLHKFKKGTVFFTNQVIKNHWNCAMLFLRHQLNGLSNDEILRELKIATIDDDKHNYYIFPK